MHSRFLQQVGYVRQLAVRLDVLALEVRGIPAGATAIADKLEAEPFRVLVIGEFSRGKSTFINALVGEKLLPSSVRPTTAVITILRNGAQRNAVIHWRDKARAPQRVDIPVGSATTELDRVVTAKNTTGSDISHVEITVPMPNLQLPFELVDTPGVNDIDTQREEITFGFLQKADAAIMMLDLQQPLSASEKRFLQEKVVSNDLRKLLFVVNKIDQEPEEKLKKALDFVGRRLGEMEAYREALVLPVAAKLALQAKQSGDNVSLGKSRFIEFEERLREFLVEASGKDRVSTAALRIERIADDLGQGLQSLLDGLGGEQADLVKATQQAENGYRTTADSARAIAADIEVAMRSYIEDATSRVTARVLSLRQSVAEIMKRKDFPQEADVGALRTLLNTGLRDVADIPAVAARRVAKALLAKHVKERKRSVKLGLGATSEEIDLRLDSDEKAGKQATTFGGVVGGLVGVALFGPLGAALTSALGGYLGGLFGQRPDSSKLSSNVIGYLTTIETRSKVVIEDSAAALRRLVEDDIVQPLNDALKNQRNVIEELRVSHQHGISERQARAQSVRRQHEQVSKIMGDLNAFRE